MNIAVIFAGGVGKRMNSKDTPKQFLDLFGKPIIIRTLEHFENNVQTDAVVIACLEEYIQYLSGLVQRYGIRKVRRIVPGGETGQLSIYNGLLAAREIAGQEDAVILIHDGVRPLITDDLITRNIETVRKYGNCITSGLVQETIAEVDDEGVVRSVPDRKHSRVAKAPQSGRLSELLSVHGQAMKDGVYNSIDTCTLLNAYGIKLHMIDGPVENIKITTREDYFLARTLLEARENNQLYHPDEERK